MRVRWLLLLAALMLSACPKTQMENGVPKHLIPMLRSYEAVVRWGDLNRMYEFAKPGTSDWERQENLQNIRVTGYEASRPREISTWEWSALAVIDYVQQDRQVVKQIVNQQIWVSDDEGASWYLKSPPVIF